MDGTKKGSDIQIRHIRAMIKNNNFKLMSKYKPAWDYMSMSAVDDAIFHCKLISTKLEKSNVPGMMELSGAELPSPKTIQLSLSSIAFIVVKIYKIFEIKLGLKGTGTLNGCHSVYWVRQIEQIHSYINNSQKANPLQFLDASYTYPPLTDRQKSLLNELKVRAEYDEDGVPYISDEDIDDIIDVPPSSGNIL